MCDPKVASNRYGCVASENIFANEKETKHLSVKNYSWFGNVIFEARIIRCKNPRRKPFVTKYGYYSTAPTWTCPTCQRQVAAKLSSDKKRVIDPMAPRYCKKCGPKAEGQCNKCTIRCRKCSTLACIRRHSTGKLCQSCELKEFSVFVKCLNLRGWRNGRKTISDPTIENIRNYYTHAPN